MTKRSEQEACCPACGHTQDVTVWQSVNVTLNPDLRERLFNADVNIFECDSCGEKAFIPAPILYHDMEREFCVQYFPFPSIQHEHEGWSDWFTEEGNLKMEGVPELEIGNYVFEPHVVFNMDEMVRYIYFREKLHDALGVSNRKKSLS